MGMKTFHCQRIPWPTEQMGAGSRAFTSKSQSARKSLPCGLSVAKGRAWQTQFVTRRRLFSKYAFPLS
jgi:hypothetical protein